MKQFFLSLIAAGILLSGCNQSNQASSGAAENSTPANKAAAPVMKFDNESHNFGKVAEGDKVVYDFKFTNAGKSPLIITDARASCGCTVPEWPHTPVKPGESASIHVVFNSAAKKGLVDKQVTVTANTNPPENRVHLIGEVIVKTK
jgi:hypothetical protein